MTAATDLRSLLEILCAPHDRDELATLLRDPAGDGGDPLPARSDPEAIRIEPTRFASIRTIEVTPWTSDWFGVADLVLDQPGGLVLGDLAQLAGPLRAMPRMPHRPAQVQAIWDEPPLPARAALYVDATPDTDPSTPITELRLRIESMEKYR